MDLAPNVITKELSKWIAHRPCLGLLHLLQTLLKCGIVRIQLKAFGIRRFSFIQFAEVEESETSTRVTLSKTTMA